MLGLEARLSKDALNIATWLRAAPVDSFNCPFCTLPCAGWGPHLPAACGKVAVAVQAGFRALVLAATPAGAEPKSMTTAWARLELHNGDNLHQVLCANHEVTAAWPPVHPHTVYITWSGRLMATCAEATHWLSTARRDRLVSV